MNDRVDFNDPAERKKYSRVGLKAFFNIAARWNLDDSEAKELLGSPDDSDFSRWKENDGEVALPQETLMRISYILGIYKNLCSLYSGDGQHGRWIKAENKAFDGESAFELMRKKDERGLSHVRSYLDYMMH